MAEAFGAVTGAAGLLTVLTAIVELRNSIQRGRNFDDDYRRCAVMLDFHLTRLERWLNAVRGTTKVDIDRDYPHVPWPKVRRLVGDALDQIKQLSLEVKRMRSKYDSASSTSSALVSAQDAGDGSGSGPAQTSWVNKMKWALWDGKDFERQVETIGNFVKELEDLIPFNFAYRRTRSDTSIGTTEEQTLRPHAQPQYRIPRRPLPAPEPINRFPLYPSRPSGYHNGGDNRAGVLTAPTSHDLIPRTNPHRGPDGISQACDEQQCGAPRRVQTIDSTYPSSKPSREVLASSTSLPIYHQGRFSVSSAPPALPQASDNHEDRDTKARRRHSEPVQRMIYISESTDGPAIAIAVDQRSKRVAYLVTSGIVLFSIECRDRLHCQLIGRHNCETTGNYSTGTPKWDGLCMSGSYIAAWGQCQKTKKFILHTSAIRTDADGCYHFNDIQMDNDDLKDCDRQRRVAVSRRGWMAVIKGSEIIILDLRTRVSKTMTDVRREGGFGTPGSQKSYFLDVSFNDQGDLLYAWSMGGLHGALICWKISMSLEPVQIFVSFYESDSNQPAFYENFLRLYPYHHNNASACVVGASSNTRFFTVSGTTLFQSQTKAAPITSISSQDLSSSKVRVCCVANNRSFITLQKPRTFAERFKVKEYDFPKEGEFSFTVGREIGKGTRRQDNPKEGTQIGVFGEGRKFRVGIFYLNGVGECVEL